MTDGNLIEPREFDNSTDTPIDVAAALSEPAAIDGPAFKLWSGGYRYLVPIVPPDAALSEKSSLIRRPQARGKAPGERNATGKWRSLIGWQTSRPTLKDLSRWTSTGAGFGIRTGEQADGSFLFAVDADTKDPAAAVLIESAVHARFGDVPIRIGEAPKALYVIRSTGALDYASLGFKGGVVEVLGERKQFVAVGVHPATRQPYKWTVGLKALLDLPAHPPADIMDLLGALRTFLPAAGDVYQEGSGNRAASQQDLIGRVDQLERAIALMPNVYKAPGREAYVKMAAAFRGAFQNDYERGLELFCEWSEKADLSSRLDDSAHEDPAQMYRSIKAPFGAGAGLLYELAEAADASGAFTKADALAARWFDEEAAEVGRQSVDQAVKGEAPASRDGARKIELLYFDDVADSALVATSKPLVEGLLDQSAMTVFYGESNTGKTFVAMDLAHSIASGRPWGGRQTAKGLVVYIAAEGGSGARKRAMALKRKYGPCANLLFILSAVDLRKPDADLEPLLKTLRSTEGIVLIVIDTLSRALAGGDENSSTDMGALVRHFDIVRTVTGAHVFIVHHTGKITAKGARGHSLLRAATDTEIEITEGQLRVTKQRDLEKCSAVGFALETVVLGQDNRGKDITSCTVRLIARGGVETGIPSAKETTVLSALNACVRATSNPSAGADLAAIADAVGESGNAGKDRVRQTLTGLTVKNLIIRVRRGAWAPRDIHADAYFVEIDQPEEAPKNLGRQHPPDTGQKTYSEPPELAPSGGLFS